MRERERHIWHKSEEIEYSMQFFVGSRAMLKKVL